MIKKGGLIFCLLLSSVLCLSLDLNYKGSLKYISKEEQLNKYRGHNWIEMIFYYDSGCNTSLSKKDEISQYHKKNNYIGNPII